MIKIIANPEKLKLLHEDERVIKAIQLMRVASTIRYNNIIQTKVMADPDYQVSIHAYLIFNHAALLYEGIRTFVELGEHLYRLGSFKRNRDKIKIITKGYGNNNSYINRVLKLIRNQIAFHFKEEAIKANLTNYIKHCVENKSEIVLISSLSRTVQDTIYVLADDVIMNCALDMIAGRDLPVEEKIKRFSEELLELSGMFLEVIDDLTIELISDIGLSIED